mgnify:CR=1 FL=1
MTKPAHSEPQAALQTSGADNIVEVTDMITGDATIRKDVGLGVLAQSKTSPEHTDLLARIRELGATVAHLNTERELDHIALRNSLNAVDQLRADLGMAKSALLFADTRCSPEVQISVTRALAHLAKYGEKTDG